MACGKNCIQANTNLYIVLRIAAAGDNLMGLPGGTSKGISKGTSNRTSKGTLNITSIGSTGGHQMGH